LKFELHGEKLRGIWNLVRMKPRPGRKAEWLLIKHGDEFARPASEYSVTEAEPLSVASGRDLDEIASGDGRVWQSRPAARRAKPRRNAKRAENRRVDPASVPGARPAVQPDFIAPQLATLVSCVPEGNEWLHELKLDGYRLVCVLSDGEARLLTRRRNDWTARFPEIARSVERLPIKNAIIDGEVVALNKAGASDFQALQNAMKSSGGAPLVYYAFDVLHCEGYDLTKSPLIERRKFLKSLISAAADKRRLRFSEHIVGRGPEFFRQVCQMEVEGIVSKLADSPYESRRSTNWRKIKCKSGQEFVIGGFTDPAGARTAFGALLVGHYSPDGRLMYAGRVGTGFNETRLRQLGAKLRQIEIPRSPFADAPRERGVHWVRPELVAEVEYGQITRDGRIRHPVFKGLRLDKSPREVVLEKPVKGPSDGTRR
ncbi:MAG TPA: non-homologous end-joining DNA ligase, partial [Phycisphaerae bacterium]